jgi:hypothetical protein
LHRLRVILVILFWIGVILFFPSLPKALFLPVRALWLLALFWLIYQLIIIKHTRFTPKKTLFILVVALIQYVGLAILCQLFITVMSQRDDRLTTRGITTLDPECKEGITAMLNSQSMNTFDPDLGWTLRPGHKSAN